MILVMGLTGAGKSYFINKLKEGSVVESSQIFSKTSKCTMIETVVGESQTPLAIVDTPGFDDSYRSDEEVFREIAKYLASQYALGIPLKGIIYLHPITHNRIQGSSRRALEMFQELCGPKALDRVVLATTMWSKLKDRSEGHDREQQLKDSVWSEMAANGSYIVPYDGSKDNAVALVTDMLGNEDTVLKIQEELVLEGKAYDETAAASVITKELDRRLLERKEEIARLDGLVQDAKRRGAHTDQKRLSGQKAKFEAERTGEERRRKLLKRRAVEDMDQNAVKEARKKKWRGRLMLFAGIVGVSVSIVTNVVLPLAGVSIAP